MPNHNVGIQFKMDRNIGEFQSIAKQVTIENQKNKESNERERWNSAAHMCFELTMRPRERE